MPLGFGVSRARGERRGERWGVYHEMAQRYHNVHQANRLKALLFKYL